MNVILNKNVLFQAEEYRVVEDVCLEVVDILHISRNEIYLEQNGRILCSNQHIRYEGDIKVNLRLIGGKGGFGSMLRAIGAQIEKTTNREACRDLSGRRLRDINAEQRMKDWIASQSESEKEAAERKKRKLEKLCQQPKHEFNDENYFKARSESEAKVEEAVLQGLEASKHASEELAKIPKKRKRSWLDAEFEGLSTSDEESSDDESSSKKSKESSSLPAEDSSSLPAEDFSSLPAEDSLSSTVEKPSSLPVEKSSSLPAEGSLSLPAEDPSSVYAESEVKTNDDAKATSI